MSNMIDELVALHPDGRGTMRNLQTGTEYAVRIGRVAGAGAALVVVADDSRKPIPTFSGDESPEEAQQRALEEQERLRIERTAEARGLSPEEVQAEDLFPGGQPPTALPPTAPQAGHVPDLDNPPADPVNALTEHERAELEAYRQADLEGRITPAEPIEPGAEAPAQAPVDPEQPEPTTEQEATTTTQKKQQQRRGRGGRAGAARSKG